ncbi:MAG: STAS domain-containing protein [Selenomonadaceae bacterium]|nr:STAS domain-containing protein [Selenomonadaceae bacterium]
MAEQIASNITYNQREERDWNVWALSGSLDVNTSPKAEIEGQKIYAAAGNLAIDLSGLKYLSSAGLRVLLRFGKRAKKEGKGFALVGAVDMVATVLKESKMDMLVTIAGSVEELK